MKSWKIIAVISALVLPVLVAGTAVYFSIDSKNLAQEEQAAPQQTAEITEPATQADPEEIVVVDERERHCLALAIYHESRNQPLEGRIAVAAVVLNRVRTGAYPNSICAVVFDRCQFSWVCDRRKQYNPEFHANVIERRAWRDAVQLLSLIHI